MLQPQRLLREMFDAAVGAATSAVCLPPFLPPAPVNGRLIVIGAGKGAAEMARVVEGHYPGPLSGVVVTRYGHGAPCQRIEVLEASHPVPDAAGVAAARRILDCVAGLGADDLVLCLISGGGSALLALPADGVTLADKQAINQALLASGATIAEINCVRKHLSTIKGGRLALACAPARVVTLVISDVPGDDPALVASGPTLADAGTCADARAILARYRIALPAAARALLDSGAGETPKPGDVRFARNSVQVIASNRLALDAAAAVARAAGITAHILADDIEGEARDIALMHASLARAVVSHGAPFARPCVILSGGETTVTVGGSGRGGRNTEFLLALGLALDGHAGIDAIACDTDGIDGSEDNAGALLGPDSLARAQAHGLRARAMLDNNDGYSFFQALGDLVVCGPTLTNVNDFRAILIV
ncbi:glycerate kinase type-2 family protein [Massilia sp. PWRC2]|uniref:glycerate kinase type-2 family protein n=1 Tax=Massilia sp. PWRC2 TaxID=2804626 RepID=UPI003CFB1875